jgi:hypothetical protein
MSLSSNPVRHQSVANVRSMLNGRTPATSRVAQDLADVRRENTQLRRENRELQRRLQATSGGTAPTTTRPGPDR